MCPQVVSVLWQPAPSRLCLLNGVAAKRKFVSLVGFLCVVKGRFSSLGYRPALSTKSWSPSEEVMTSWWDTKLVWSWRVKARTGLLAALVPPVSPTPWSVPGATLWSTVNMKLYSGITSVLQLRKYENRSWSFLCGPLPRRGAGACLFQSLRWTGVIRAQHRSPSERSWNLKGPANQIPCCMRSHHALASP